MPRVAIGTHRELETKSRIRQYIVAVTNTLLSCRPNLEVSMTIPDDVTQ